MNKKKFQKLIYSSVDLSDSELGQLAELQKDYPFSQVIHAVVAKSSLNKGTSNAQSKLGHAAIYSTNRKVLKKFIEAKPLPETKETTKQKLAETKVTKKTAPKPKRQVETVKKKTELENTPIKGRKVKPTPQKAAKKTIDSSKEASPIKQLEEKKSVEPLQKKPLSITPTKGSVKRKAPDEMELLRNEVMNNLKELKIKIKNFEKEDGSAQKKSKVKKKQVPKKAIKEELPEANKPAENDLIDQINALDEKEVGEKQKKQNQLIEEFVHRDPEKIKAADPDPDKEVSDLARESVNFNEELVSENLAIIFAKQGKREKAIEIYKKLIWKYPQKKTYFATQIEDLEKN